MGTAQSTAYQNIDRKPFVAPVAHIFECGEEYVRFLDTAWNDVAASPAKDSGSKSIYCQKTLRVQGQHTGEIYHLSKESLLVACDGDSRRVSRIVNRKRDHELYIRWTVGLARDPRTIMPKDASFVCAVPDPSTGELMRKVDGRQNPFLD